MDHLRSTPSPTLPSVVRRRKKRSTPTNSVPGSSLSGLNRNSIRIVELLRGNVGYGFTISGQKPCLLRCIVEGSPAERACLRPGNCLVGVNGKDVSHLAHDEVVGIIGTCTGLLRLHVADSYFSESSDEESFQINHSRPKYSHRQRVLSKTTSSKKLISPSKKSGGGKLECSSKEKVTTTTAKLVRSNQKTPEPIHPNLSPIMRRLSWDPLMPTPRRVPRPPLPLDEESPIPALPVRTRKVINPNVEIVRVFTHLDNPGDLNNVQPKFNLPSITSEDIVGSTCDRFSTQSSSGSSSRTHNLGSVSNGNPSPRSTSSIGPDSVDSSSTYQAVVGYVGSVELPVIEERKRLQALTSCVRRLRVERRMRSIVLLRIQPDGISLFSSSQNVQTGPPLAFYSSGIISFCGAYSDDRRFFGLVTCVNPNKNCSCHVFMVEPKLLSHLEHSRRARAFGIQCTLIPVPKSGQVLGLQECTEFPATADPILSSILRLHRSVDDQQTQRSPSEASIRLESTTSSNSDSGIGFREDSDRNSARIYDIVEPELLFDIKNIRRSPVPSRKRYPLPHKKSTMSDCLSCQQPTALEQYQQDLEMKSISSERVSSSNSSSRPSVSNIKPSFAFEADPRSLQEILGKKESESPDSTSNRRLSKISREKESSNHLYSSQPPHIEVSVVVTPTKNREKVSSSCEPAISPTTTVSDHCNGLRTSFCRNGSKSLDNLCSPEIFVQQGFESKGISVGSSTPALNQESTKSNAGDDFWEFKVPQPPKPKMEVNRIEVWAESIEKLLADHCGREVFTEFLQHEFSAENILFYNACLRYKEAFKNLTQSQRISMASTIFQKYLQTGATDPVNVDFQARCHVEKLLSQPVAEMFDLPLGQVFNLLKFDCYPRFLRSDMYRDYSNGVTQLPQYCEDSDQGSEKSNKLHNDGRRRSLLPWNIRNRSKKSSKNKGEADRLNSDISFIQRTAMNQAGDSSDTDDGRRQSYKLCRVTLPDNSTTVLPCKSGETLSAVVQRLLEKREFHYSAFEVINVSTGKAIDLTQEVSEMTAREIRVEPRAFIGIELPRGWRVGVRANPTRKIAEVLKPILSQHSLKVDAVNVYDIETEELLDVKSQMGGVDGHNLLVKLKDSKLEEITNNVQEFDTYETAYMDDDETSNKTSSSQASSVFRGFLRRSSKKYKRRGKKLQDFDGVSSEKGSVDNESITLNPPNAAEPQVLKQIPPTTPRCDENSHPHRRLKPNMPSTSASPLSLVSSELSLTENSRNRKPIYYIAQSNHNTES